MWAFLIVLISMVAGAIVEYLLRRIGPQAVVLAYWSSVGVRGGLALCAALVVGATLPAEERAEFGLWFLAAYLLALVVETVRLVRQADRAEKIRTRGAGKEGSQ
jgi:hypothetical protein